jgi:hypothetical protein
MICISCSRYFFPTSKTAKLTSIDEMLLLPCFRVNYPVWSRHQGLAQYKKSRRIKEVAELALKPESSQNADLDDIVSHRCYFERRLHVPVFSITSKLDVELAICEMIAPVIATG